MKRSPSPDNTTVAPDHSAVQRTHWASPGCPYESGTSEPAPHQRPAPEVPARCVGGTSHDGHERISRASSVSNLVHSRIPCQHLGDRSAHPTEKPGLLFSRELRSVHGRCVGKKPTTLLLLRLPRVRDILLRRGCSGRCNHPPGSHVALIGRELDGTFHTAKAKVYPYGLNKILGEALFQAATQWSDLDVAQSLPDDFTPYLEQSCHDAAVVQPDYHGGS